MSYKPKAFAWYEPTVVVPSHPTNSTRSSPPDRSVATRSGMASSFRRGKRIPILPLSVNDTRDRRISRPAKPTASGKTPPHPPTTPSPPGNGSYPGRTPCPCRHPRGEPTRIRPHHPLVLPLRHLVHAQVKRLRDPHAVLVFVVLTLRLSLRRPHQELPRRDQRQLHADAVGDVPGKTQVISPCLLVLLRGLGIEGCNSEGRCFGWRCLPCSRSRLPIVGLPILGSLGLFWRPPALPAGGKQRHDAQHAKHR